MRSPLGAIGPVLAILTLALVLGVVLLIVQSAGLRGDVDAARGEVTALRAELETFERGVPMSELSMRLAALENDVRGWVTTLSRDLEPAASPGTGGGGLSRGDREAILDRLDEVLDEIEALGDRVDRICEGVPVC